MSLEETPQLIISEKKVVGKNLHSALKGLITNLTILYVTLLISFVRIRILGRACNRLKRFSLFTQIIMNTTITPAIWSLLQHNIYKNQKKKIEKRPNFDRKTIYTLFLFLFLFPNFFLALTFWRHYCLVWYLWRTVLEDVKIKAY